MMNPGMKMMMMERVRQQPENNRSEYGGNAQRRMIGYDRNYETENRRRRDERGRYAEGEGWEGNRMAYGMEEPEARRRRDSRGRYAEGEGWQNNYGYPQSNYGSETRRRRDSRGRYMMNGSRMDGDYEDDDDDDDMRARSQTWYPPYGAMPYMPHTPPMSMHNPGNSYGDIYARGTIYAPGAMNRPMGMEQDYSAPVDEKTAREWVQRMSSGQKYSPEQAEQLRTAHCPSCEKWEWYVALNASYSDHCESAKTMGLDKNEFYAMMAKDFLKDKDAGPHKLRKYMEIIPK